jgi:hypothetical protein
VISPGLIHAGDAVRKIILSPQRATVRVRTMRPIVFH